MVVEAGLGLVEQGDGVVESGLAGEVGQLRQFAGLVGLEGSLFARLPGAVHGPRSGSYCLEDHEAAVVG